MARKSQKCKMTEHIIKIRNKISLGSFSISKDFFSDHCSHLLTEDDAGAVAGSATLIPHSIITSFVPRGREQ